MGDSSVQTIELIFLLLLLFVVVLGALAKKVKVAYPIVLVIGGGLLGLIPGIPKVELNPDVIFYVVLPPLLYAAAWTTSWREFSRSFLTIFLLAFGLVAFTVVGVSQLAPSLIPGFDWRLGLVLGAVVAPTDAIAATSIASRIGLPKRISNLLEAESLINDATGLLALEFAIAIVVRSETVTAMQATGRLVFLTVAGIAIGLACGWIASWVEHRIDDAPIEISLSILIPYAAYFAGNYVHASGVLSVVACGLYLSRRSSSFFSPKVRLQIWAVWDSLVFAINGLVFVLIGLQLPYVLAGIKGYGPRQLLISGVLFSALIILLRLVWVFPGAYLSNWARNRWLHQHDPAPHARRVWLLGWTGMRGVISLAAAISLPQTLSSGEPFPYRNLIIFLAFCVIFVTLVLQGLTLPHVVRLLGIKELSSKDDEEGNARRQILQAALDHLDEVRAKGEAGWDELYDDLEGHYRQRLVATTGEADDANRIHPEHQERIGSLVRELLQVERDTAVRLRDEGKISDEVLRDLEHELDLRESATKAAA